MQALACDISYLPRIAEAISSFRPTSAGENSPYPLLSRPEIQLIDSISHSVISGPMISDDDFYQAGLSNTLFKLIEMDRSTECVAHYIKFDTGGGFVTAGQAAYDAIASLRKPVLAHAVYCCSAGIMAASAADEIMISSDGMSVLGSVGVMQSYPKWYIDFYTQLQFDVYARSSDRKNEEFKSLVGSGKDDSMTKDKLDLLDRAFMELVKVNRKLKTGARVSKEGLSGATFVGRSAIEVGLADSQGNYNKAISRLKTLIKKA